MGSRRRIRKPPFKFGQIVFAKMRGSRAWPGRLINDLGYAFNVYFYGTWNHAKVPKKNIFDFEKHSKRYGKVKEANSKVSQSFQSAMLEAQQAVSEPRFDIGFLNMVAHLTHDKAAESNVPDSDSDASDLQDDELMVDGIKRRHIVADSTTDMDSDC